MERIRPIITSFSYPGDKEEVMTELKIIAAREKVFMSDIIFGLIKEYVKNHSEGNPVFSLDRWQEDPEFKALPAFMSSKERWLSYLKEQTDKEERLKILDTSNYISGVIKNIFYNESLNK